MQDLENAYNEIKNVYEIAYKEYKKRNIDACLQWIVENMYRINHAYEYIKNNSDNLSEKKKILIKQIIKLGEISKQLKTRINFKYVKKNIKTKLEQKIEECILEIEYAENIYEKNEIDNSIDKSNLVEIEKDKLEEKAKIKLYNIGKEYFKYIIDTVNEETNFLGIDSMDFSRLKKNRNKYETSPTNIGFIIISIISGIDLNYIEKEKAEKILNKVIENIETLEREDGLFFNWYNSKDKKVTNTFISAVDNGNLLSSLYVANSYYKFKNKLVLKLINQMKMSKLIDEKKQAVCIGIKDKEQTINIYDRLMSEYRLTLFIMIARGEASKDIWYKLKREKIKNMDALYSWTGCAFEYFLPNIFLPTYKNTKITNSLINCYNQNVKYMKENNLPAFGVNASSYPRKTKYNVYAYKEFGIPSIRLREDRFEDYTISPSGSILMIDINPKEVVYNLEILEQIGLNGKYGLFDAIDLDIRTKDKKDKYKIAKIYNTHNVTMSIMSINNYLNNNIIKKRFMENDIFKNIVDILI